MGLATVRRIVEDAGGIIGVDTGPGKGRMTVRLAEVHRAWTMNEPCGKHAARPQPLWDIAPARQNLPIRRFG